MAESETRAAGSNRPQPAVVIHECRRCGQPFEYRFDGRYDPEHLVDIDFICMGCFEAYIHEREVAHCA